MTQFVIVTITVDWYFIFASIFVWILALLLGLVLAFIFYPPTKPNVCGPYSLENEMSFVLDYWVALVSTWKFRKPYAQLLPYPWPINHIVAKVKLCWFPPAVQVASLDPQKYAEYDPYLPNQIQVNTVV